MEYRKVGKWGIRVSEVGLGSWLTYGAALEEAESIRQIHYAFDKGVNFFDTANVYGHGDGEVVVGKALRSFNRDAYVLATKVYFPMGPGPNDRGLSRKHIFDQCHASLNRLKMDYIDIYQCHRYDQNVELYEVVTAMNDLIRRGKILYWGVSEWSAEQIENAVAISEKVNGLPPISNQPQYNMLSRKIEDSVIPMSAKLGLGQVAFSPLAQGVLTGKYKRGEKHPADSRALDNRQNAFIGHYLNDETLTIVESLNKIANELNLTMAQLALAWCLRLPEVSSVIIGATKTAQLDDNIVASGKKLSTEVQARIDSILRALVRS